MTVKHKCSLPVDKSLTSLAPHSVIVIDEDYEIRNYLLDCAAGVSRAVATTTRDQGTQTGARPPVLVRRLLGRARARRFTRLSLRRQQQQQHPQGRKQERSPAKPAGAVGRSGEAPGSSPPVAEDWQRWQSCCVASMLMVPVEGNSTPSGGEPNQSPSLSIRSHESSSQLLDAIRPCSVELLRLTEKEIVRWQHRREPEGRRRWSLRDLDKPGQSVAAPDMSEPKKQRRKRGLSTDSSASSQRSASAGRRRAAPVNSVLPRSERFTNLEARSVEPAHRTRRVSYSSASEDGQMLNKHANSRTGKASKRVKVAAESSTSDRTLREREAGEKADKGQAGEAVTDAGNDAESPAFSAAVATADLGTELSVPPVEKRVSHSRRERKLSSKRHLAVEVIESVPNSDASSSSLSPTSHLVNRSSDPEGSTSRPSIICRIRIQGKHGVISTTSTRPRVVGFVSPDRSTTESRVADLGSPPTFGASESSSSTVVETQMSDGSVPAATPLSSEVTNLSESLKVKVSKRNQSSSATPEATETRLKSPERAYSSTEPLATHLSPEVVDPVEVLKRKVSKQSRSSIVTPEASVVHFESSEATHMLDASSLATPSNSEMADSGVALRRPKRLRKGQSSSVTPEAPVTQSESSEVVRAVDSLESAASPSTSELADPGATLRTKSSRKGKLSDMTPEAPAVQLEGSKSAPVSGASTSLATHLSSELADSGAALRRPRKSKTSTVTPEAPEASAVHLESAEASCASDATTPLATPLSTEVVDSGGAGQPKSSWKSKLRTAASDTRDVHLESCKAGNVPSTHESDPTTLSSEVTDHSASLKVKISRRSKLSITKPETPAAHLESSEAAHMPNAPNPVATPLRSDTEDSGVVLRPKRTRKSKYGNVTTEAPGTHLESSQVVHAPDAPPSFAAPSSAEVVDSGTVLRSKRSRKSKSNITTPETPLESSQAIPTPDVATSAVPLSSKVADSGALLRPKSSRKSKSNMVTSEAPETQLESSKPMLSDAPPTAVEPKVPEAATCSLPSRRNVRSASDVGPKRTRRASTSSPCKPTEFPEPFTSGPASIGDMHDHQLVPLMGAQDAALGTSQSSGDVDAIQEPENVMPVSQRGRRRRIVSLCSSSDSQDATNIPSDDSTAHSENAVQATTRHTRRQAASSKLSLRDVSATRSSSAESVTSTSSCEVLSGGLTEMSLPKQEILSKQASGVEEPSSSKVVVRRMRSRGNSSSASLSHSTESTNAMAPGTTSTVQGGAKTAPSKEAKSRSSSRISANKLALRRKVREEDNNEGKPGAPEQQNDNCLVADTSGSRSPVFDVGVASTATTGTVTSNVSPFDSASCSTGASFAKLVSNRTTTRLVSSGLQVTSSSTPNDGIPKPGAPEAVGPHERPVSSAPRLGTPSSKREVGGLPIRSSKPRKKAALPEAPDPRIQELLVTYERLTITTPSELSGDDSVGSKQPDVAQPSPSFNLPEAAGSGNPPQTSPSSSGTDSVQKEGSQRCESHRAPEAEHLKGLSDSSNLVDTKESDSSKSGASSSTRGAAEASGLMKGAAKGMENSPESVPEPEPVPNCAVSEPDVTDSDRPSSSVNTANKDFVATGGLETSLLHPKQRQCDDTASDVLPVSSDIPISEVTMAEPNIELEAPEEANASSAVSSELAAANASTNANFDAGLNGPVPVGSVQGNSSVISVSEAEISEPIAKPGVSDVARIDAPADELLLSSSSKKLLRTSQPSPSSISSKARREPPTSPVGNGFDNSSSSSINTAVEHSRFHVTSPIEQSSSEILDSHQALQECPAADLVTELNWSIESGQKATEGCTEKATDAAGTPEPVPIPCGQKGNKLSVASSDDVQLEAESSSHICADSEQAAADQESAADSTNSAEVSSADDDFICLSPGGDEDWILLDEVRDDSIELFPSSEGSIAAEGNESCGDDTNVDNSVLASEVNCVDVDVCKKETGDNIGDIGKTGKDIVGASSEKSVRDDGSWVDPVQHSGRESSSKKSIARVCTESCTGNNCDANCGSCDGNVKSVDGASSVTGDNCVVDSGGESCSEAASSMEHFEISSETLANNSCEEILRNFGSDSSMIDVGSESFLDPTGSDKCMEEMAKEDCANITSADLVQDFGSENCVGDIGSEGVEFIASENFIEDIGSEESMELFSGTDSESKQHKKAAAVGESSDSRQHEDTSAMVAAAKSLRVVLERLDDIDARSAIGMLYCKAKKALKYNRAPCKVVEIAENKPERRPENLQAEHAGTEKKDRTVGRSTASKSPVFHRQTLRPSKSLHRDTREPSSQRGPSDPQAQHRSPREQDSSVQPVSAEKAPNSNQKTFKSSKTSHKGLSDSGNQHSSGEPQAQHVNAQEQDGSVAPFSEDKPSFVKQASKSSKSLHKDHRDTRIQHLEKSADGSKAKPTGARKKDRSANRLSVDKSSNGHQNVSNASKSSSQDVKVAKNKDSDASTSKREAQHAVVEKQKVRVAHSSLERSSSRDQEALKSSKTSHRAFKVAKNKDSAASASKAEVQQPFKVTKNKDSAASSRKAEAQQPGTEKQGDGFDHSSVKESPCHDQEASKFSKTSHRAFKVTKNKDSAASSRKAESQQLGTEKQGDGVAHSSLERSSSRDQEALKSSKTSHRTFTVAKNKDSAASASKAEVQQPGTEKRGDSVDHSSVEESPCLDQEASKSSKTSHRAFKVIKNKDSAASSRKAEAQQPGTEKQGDCVDHSSVEESPCHDQEASKSSKASHRAFNVTKNKDSAASSRKAEAQQPGTEKQGDCVDHSSVEESPCLDQEASKSSKTSHRAFKVIKNKDSAASSRKAEAQQPGTEKQGDCVDHSSVEESPCHDQEASKSSKASHRAFNVTKNKDSAASSRKAEAQQPGTEKQGEGFDHSSVEESSCHDQEASKSSKTFHGAFKVSKNKDSPASPNKAEAQQLGPEKQGDIVDHSSAKEPPCHDQEALKFPKASCWNFNIDKNKGSPASLNKAEAQQAVAEKQRDSVDPFSFERSQSQDQELLKSLKTSHQDFKVTENKDSHTSPNKAEAQQAVTEKQGNDVGPFSLEKSSSQDQRASRSSSPLNKGVPTFHNQIPVCENRELRPGNIEDQKAGGDLQQDECAEPLQIARSEPLPPTDMGKVPGLLDQVLDLGELPDAIKCLLDSEVPLPELDADCFSLPPDSTRWLSEDGVVEKRKPDERPQNKEDQTPFCPSSDIVLGDLTKACSLTNEGLVALVPAVPPPTCGPHFNSSNTPRARKKCLRGLAHWQKTKLEAFARDSCFEVDFEHNPELRIAFCRDRSVVLTPARSAPTVALLAPTHQRPPPSPDDDAVSIRELPPLDASPDPSMLLVSPPSTPPRHETSTSQLDGPSGRFALSGARLPADTERVLTVLSVEVHVRTRSDLRPDPAHDPVQCVLWCARGYGVDAPLEAGAMHWGTVNSDPRQADIEDLAGTSLHRTGVATPSLRTQVVRSELDLLHAVIDLVHR
ncbi:microtubule-associated protein futsch [Rhipicephalus sanguineus]|uniref:microtubule-associated protein futsch n=1 Tax=Rhipicephalus sanguineus TaxID=34632 RepID=UPI0018958FBE|nr:microtubule-associated protein futsch [Rhipicephalus sanguineus]